MGWFVTATTTADHVHPIFFKDILPCGNERYFCFITLAAVDEREGVAEHATEALERLLDYRLFRVDKLLGLHIFIFI